MKPADLLPTDPAVVDLTLARGVAITQYVSLETSFASLYQMLSMSGAAKEDMRLFYDMNNFDRFKVIGEILTSKSPARYSSYCDSLLDDLKRLVDMRNFIAHAQQILGGEEVKLGEAHGSYSRKYGPHLVPQEWSGSFSRVKKMAVHDVTAAAKRFGYCSSCVGMLTHTLLAGKAPTEQLETMLHNKHEIQPSPKHPLFWAYNFDHLRSG